MLISVYGFMIPFVIGLVMFGISGEGVQSLDHMVWVMWALYFAFLLGQMGIYYLARRREHMRGYVTIFNRFKHLPQVDDRTRRVIRLPGEDYLTPEECDRRLELIRQAIRAEEGAGGGTGDGRV